MKTFRTCLPVPWVGLMMVTGWVLTPALLVASPCFAAPWVPAAPVPRVWVEGDSPADDRGDTDRSGVRIKIELPVTSRTADEVRLVLKQMVKDAPPVARPEDRQVVVLEFDTSGGKTGQGSELEACQSLARFLASSTMNRVETIAYIPADPDAPDGAGRLNGHAVLIAVSANQIAMDRNTSIGKAGIGEERIEPLVREVYRAIASQRFTLPVPVVMGMLDPAMQVFRVDTGSGVVYADAEELRNLEAQGQTNTTTLAREGEMVSLTAEQLDEFRLLRYRVTSRNDLASKLDLAPHSLDRNTISAQPWKGVEIRLPAILDERTATWVIRSLNQKLAQPNAPNLVILTLDGKRDALDGSLDPNQGDWEAELEASFQLARYLVDLDSDRVTTVAFVQTEARGAAGLIALSCDQIVMASDARLGGHPRGASPGQPDGIDRVHDLKPMIDELAHDKKTPSSLMMAMFDPNLVIQRYRHRRSGQIRLLSEEEKLELDDAEDWIELGPIDIKQGLTAKAAEQLNVSYHIADDLQEIKTLYQLEEMPPALEPSVTDRWIERVASTLASPFITLMLLWGGMFFLSSEMSAPGLGLPGFLSAVCFMLFFWSQYCDGNAEWFEIIMFVAGVIFVMMEIFVIPGVGIFGIGGMLMILTSLVLASQNFLIPKTSAEWAQIPYSLMPVLGGGLGIITAAIVLRNVIPKSPYLNRMLLQPRKRRADTGLDADRDPELIVDWSFLTGRSGVTITRLVPSGKARIDGAVYDVITDGRMVDKGQKIVVVEAVGNRVVVREEE